MDECIPINKYAFEMQSSNCPFLVSLTGKPNQIVVVENFVKFDGQVYV